MQFVILNVAVSLGSFETDFQVIWYFAFSPSHIKELQFSLKRRKIYYALRRNPRVLCARLWESIRKSASENLEVITKRKHRNR